MHVGPNVQIIKNTWFAADIGLFDLNQNGHSLASVMAELKVITRWDGHNSIGRYSI
jgi:hypothetical protein